MAHNNYNPKDIRELDREILRLQKLAHKKQDEHMQRVEEEFQEAIEASGQIIVDMEKAINKWKKRIKEISILFIIAISITCLFMVGAVVVHFLVSSLNQYIKPLLYTGTVSFFFALFFYFKYEKEAEELPVIIEWFDDKIKKDKMEVEKILEKLKDFDPEVKELMRQIAFLQDQRQNI